MIAEHTGNPDHSQAALGSRGGADRRRGDARRRRGGAACAHAVAVRRRRGGRRRRATRSWSPTSGARRSRSRRSRSSACGRIWTTPRSRSPAPRTSRGRSSSTRCAACSRRRRRPRTTSNAGPSRRGSSTTAPGKHAGMLALCRARGWPTEGYRLARAPVPAGAPATRSPRAAEVDPESMPTAADGCGIPTFALTLERMAHAFSRLGRLDGGSRVIAAMRAHPDLIRGPLAADTDAHADAARLGGEGRRGGAALRGLGRRPRRRAQGRGRQRSGRYGLRWRRSSRRSGSTPASSDIVPGRELARRGRRRAPRSLRTRVRPWSCTRRGRIVGELLRMSRSDLCETAKSD